MGASSRATSLAADSTAQLAREFEEKEEVSKTASTRAGLDTVKTRRYHVKTTTITKDEREVPPPVPVVKDTREADEAQAKFKFRCSELERELSDARRALSAMAPVAKDSASLLRKQLDEMRAFSKRLDCIKDKLGDLHDFAADCIKRNLLSNPDEANAKLAELGKQLAELRKAAAKRLKDIEDSLRRLEAQREAEAKFYAKLDAVKREIDELERQLNGMAPVGADLATLQAQLAEMQDFKRRAAKVRSHLNDVSALGEQLIRDALVANPRELRDAIDACKQRLDDIDRRAELRTRDIEDALRRLDKVRAASERFRLRLDALRKAIGELERRLDAMAPVARDRQTLVAQLAEVNDFLASVARVRDEARAIGELAEQLISDKLADDPSAWRSALGECTARLDKLEERARKRLKDIEDALRKRDELDKAEAEFERAARALAAKLDAARRALNLDEQVNGDLDTVNVLIAQHEAFSSEGQRELKALVDDTKRREAELLASSPTNPAAIRAAASGVEAKWRELQRACRDKSAKLVDAQRLAASLHATLHSLLEALAQVDASLRKLTATSASPTSTDEAACSVELGKLETLSRKLNTELAADKEQCVRALRSLLAKCSVDAEPVLRHWLHHVPLRFDSLDSQLKARATKLAAQLKALRDALAAAGELMKYLARHELRLATLSTQLAELEAPKLSALLAEHENFVGELRRREPQVERVVRVFASGAKGGACADNQLIVHTSSSSSSSSSAATASHDTNADTSFGSFSGHVPNVSNNRCKALLGKWTNVWQLSVELLEKLKRQLHATSGQTSAQSSASAPVSDGAVSFDSLRASLVGCLASSGSTPKQFFRTLASESRAGRHQQQVRVEEFASAAARLLQSGTGSSTWRANAIEPLARTNLDANGDGNVELGDIIVGLCNRQPADGELISERLDAMLGKTAAGKATHVGGAMFKFGDLLCAPRALKIDATSNELSVRRGANEWQPLSESLLRQLIAGNSS